MAIIVIIIGFRRLVQLRKANTSFIWRNLTSRGLDSMTINRIRHYVFVSHKARPPASEQAVADSDDSQGGAGSDAMTAVEGAA